MTPSISNKDDNKDHFLDPFITDDVVHVERHIKVHGNGNGNGSNGNGALNRAVNGVLMTGLARLSMIAIWPILVGVGWVSYNVGHEFFAHLINSIDTLGDKLEKTTQDTSRRIQDVVFATRDLKQSVDLGITTRVDTQDKQITDHEDRLRRLEYVQHPAPAPVPRVNVTPARRESTAASPAAVTATPNTTIFPVWSR